MRFAVCTAVMLSPLTVHQAKQLFAGAVERIGVDVDAIDVFGQGHEAETIREPVGEIVGAELKPQAQGNEVEIETGMAEMGNAFSKFVESPGGAAQRKSDFQRFAEIKGLQSGLIGEFGMLFAEIADHHAQIGTERG